MKRFVTLKTLILVFAMLLAIIPVGAAERPYAASGNGLATFITDASGNVVGATVGIATGDMVFQSGTGRFQGASGRAAIIVEQNFITGAYTFTMVGNVNY